MSSICDLHDKLKGLALFVEFSSDELDAFIDLAEPVSAKKDECIVKQDEPGDCMFIVAEGDAQVIHRKDGRRFNLATLHPGDFFGELALVDEGPRSAHVEALTDCVLLKIPQSVIRALAGVYPSAAFKLLIAVGRVMVVRMRRGNQKYIDSLLLAADSTEA